MIEPLTDTPPNKLSRQGPQLIPSFCTQCRSRCGCFAEVEGRHLIAIHPDPSHPTGRHLCAKGRASPDLVHHADRLLTPLRRTSARGAADPAFAPIGWDEALDEVAERLKTIREEDGAQATAFSLTTPSGTHIGDSAPFVERLVRGYGSPNLIYGTEICNWHKDHATAFTFGSGIGTPDFARSDLIILWGHNPTATWLARATEVRDAQRRGAKLLVVDPRRTALAARADVWLPVRPGTDAAVALCLAGLLIEAGRVDTEFLRRWSNAPMLLDGDRLAKQDGAPLALGPDGEIIVCDGTHAPDGLALDGTAVVRGPHIATAFLTLADRARAWSVDRTSALSGIEPQRLLNAAALIGHSRRVSYYAWNGVAQSDSATEIDRSIALLYALTGCTGKAGGNVPGTAAPFGTITGSLPDGQPEKALGRDRRPLGPPAAGWVTARDAYRAIVEEKPYRVRALVSFGGNLLASQPDPHRALRALQRLELHVHVDFFLNATAREADIVLPAATSWEREALRTGFDVSLDGLRRVQLRRAAIPPVGEARSDTDIAIALGERLGVDMFGGSADAAYEAILAPAGVSLADLKAHPEGIVTASEVPLEAHARETHTGRPRGFGTPSGLVEIFSERLAAHGAGLPTGPTDTHPVSQLQLQSLTLTGAKTVAYCHSQHRNIAALRHLEPEPIVELSREDAAARQITDGAHVEVSANGRTVRARAKVTAMARGVVVGRHGWREADDSANVNVLVDTTREDPISGSINLRRTPCKIRPVA